MEYCHIALVALVALAVGFCLGVTAESDSAVNDCIHLEKTRIHGKGFECREIKNDRQ